jgi:hypothetical protein
VQEQPAQLSQGVVMTAEHETAAGIPVESVGQPRRIRILEGDGIQPLLQVMGDFCAGMDRQAGRFVQDQHIGVTVQNTLPDIVCGEGHERWSGGSKSTALELVILNRFSDAGGLVHNTVFS